MSLKRDLLRFVLVLAGGKVDALASVLLLEGYRSQGMTTMQPRKISWAEVLFTLLLLMWRFL